MMDIDDGVKKRQETVLIGWYGIGVSVAFCAGQQSEDDIDGDEYVDGFCVYEYAARDHDQGSADASGSRV